MLATSAGWLRVFHNRGLRKVFISAFVVVLVFQWFSSRSALQPARKDAPLLDQVFQQGHGNGGRKLMRPTHLHRFCEI